MSNRWTMEDIAKLGIDRSKNKIPIKWANAEVINGKTFKNVPPKHKQKREESLQIKVVEYLKLIHPEIIFRSDFAAGIKMTMGQAVKHRRMQQSRAYPDLFIAHVNTRYAGLYIELKKDIGEVYRKDGKMREDSHIIEQNNMLLELEKRGYCAKFGFGFDFTIKLIENYLKIK